MARRGKSRKNHIDSDGNWYRASKAAPEQILDLCPEKNEISGRVHSIIDKFAERGLRSLSENVTKLQFVVGLGDKVSPTDIEEGMPVGVDRNKYQIQIPLAPKIDPSVTMMTVEEKLDVTYNDVGGCKEQIEKMREVVELPMLHPEKFVKLGIDPPKGVLCYGPPGTGKTLLARAVANRTDACFIRVIGSELVQKYVGEGARMVRKLFQMAHSKKACIVFFDEVDAIGGARFDEKMRELGIDPRKGVLCFGPPGTGKTLLARAAANRTDACFLRAIGSELVQKYVGEGARMVREWLSGMKACIVFFDEVEAIGGTRFDDGVNIKKCMHRSRMYAIRARRKTVTEKDFLDAVNMVIKGYKKFSATPKYMVYN
ncbi:hypothetical protein ACLB2K_055071 [Fragaria x ananassa]